MSTTIEQLRIEIERLRAQLATVAGIAAAEETLRQGIAERERQISALALNGSDTETLMPGAVNVARTNATHGPQISGPLTSGRDINVATNQTIHNVDNSSSDHTQVGDIIGSVGVAISQGAQSTVRSVTTSGGDYAEGNIDKRAGMFVTGDQFNLSGNFSGANVNIKSTLNNVAQSINAAPHANAATKAKLAKLLIQLSAALQQVPAELALDAEALAEMAKAAIEQAMKEKPNKLLVQLSAEGLRKAATNLATVIPMVVDIAAKIDDQLRTIML